jgi:hypothetical protein
MNRAIEFVKIRLINAMKRFWVFKLSLPRRSTIISVVLVLTIANAGLILPAQAAPISATEFRFFMSARKLKGNATICVGDEVPIHVKVMRAEMVGDPANMGYVQGMPGVRIDGSVTDAGIGTLTWTTIYTGWDFNDPAGADFKFHADKAGMTTINFTGKINHIWWASKYLIGLPPLTDRRDFVTGQVDITVEECQYKVTAISTFSVPGVRLKAVILDAGLVLDTDSRFKGKATVTWVGGPVSMFGCNGTMEVAPSQVELVGTKSPGQYANQLTVEVAYSDASLTHIYDCKPGSVEIHPTEHPDPIIFSVPLSGGSVFLEDQKLICTLVNCEAWNFPGFVTVVVTRVARH